MTEKVAQVHSKEVAGKLWAFLHEMTLLSTSMPDWVVFEQLVRQVFLLLRGAVVIPAGQQLKHRLLDVEVLIAELRGDCLRCLYQRQILILL